MSTSLQASEDRLEAALKSERDVASIRQYITAVLESAAADRPTVGPRSGLTAALARTGDEGKWIELAAGVHEPLDQFMVKLLGELGGDSSARLIGEKVLGATGDQAHALVRAGIAALRNIGGVTAAVLLAQLAGDERTQEDLRRRAFFAIEEIASFGSERVAEGGIISIDQDAVAFWDRHRSDLPLWQPGRIIEELDRIHGGEWEQRANAVRGVVLTQMRGELEAELKRQMDPVLFVSHGMLAASDKPSRWREAARCAVFLSHFGELQVNPHWMSGRLPNSEDLACAVISRHVRTWRSPLTLSRPSDVYRTIFHCRQLATPGHAPENAEAEVFAFGERNALTLLLELARGQSDPSRPILVTGTASARRNFVTSAFAEQRAGRPIREFTCSRWPRTSLDRFLGEVTGPGWATLFLDEIEALTPAAQAHLLEVIGKSAARLVLAGTSRTPDELEAGRLLEAPILDWLSSGVTLYVSQAV